MSEPVAALCAVLEEEARTCAALVEMLRREQQAVVALRPEEVFACLVERERLAAELAGVAERRRRLGSAIAGSSPLGAVLPLLPPAARGPVRSRLRALRATLLEARGLERQNGRLAAAALERVGDLLGALRAVVPGARYGADARLDAEAPRDRLDRRA